MGTARLGFPGEPLAGLDDRGPMNRVLYIATTCRAAPLKELFESMRFDMACAMTVEFIVDRRDQKGCAWLRTATAERRQSDRRQHREQDALARNGWARIVAALEFALADGH